MKSILKFTIIFIVIELIFCFDSMVSLSNAQSVDIHFDGNMDLMTSLRYQRRMWTSTDGTMGIVIQRGTLGNQGETGLVLLRSIDNGASWNFVMQINNHFSAIADGFIDNNNKIWLVVSTVDQLAGKWYDVKLVLLDYDSPNKTWGLERENMVFDSVSLTGASGASITKDSLNKLWVSFRYYNSLDYWIEVVYSDDNGFTWKHCNQSFGTRNSSWNKFGKIVSFKGNIGIIYHDFDGVNNVKKWAYRNDFDLDNANWVNSNINITSIFEKWGSHFSVTTDDLGIVHLTYADHYYRILYQKYDGNWSLPIIIYEGYSDYPNITTDGENLWIIFMQIYDSQENRIAYKKYTKLTDSWDINISYLTDPSERPFDKRIIPASPYISGDYVYLGMLERFDYLAFNVSIAGISGTISWEYWNGINWALLPIIEFKNSDFQNLDYGFLRFIKPDDWMTKSTLNDPTPYFPIRGVVTNSFINDLKVKRLSTIKNNKRPSVPERVTNILPVIWQEGVIAPYRIKYNSLSF